MSTLAYFIFIDVLLTGVISFFCYKLGQSKERINFWAEKSRFIQAFEKDDTINPLLKLQFLKFYEAYMMGEKARSMVQHNPTKRKIPTE